MTPPQPLRVGRHRSFATVLKLSGALVLLASLAVGTRGVAAGFIGEALYCGHVARAARTRTPASKTLMRQQCRPTEEAGPGRSLPAAGRPLRVLIVGAGIGGLALALALAGEAEFHVTIAEKASELKPQGGPIQLASNGLAALRAIDPEALLEAATSAVVIGKRANGLRDGLSGAWHARFDLVRPALERGLPFTVVIDRCELQSILLRRLLRRRGAPLLLLGTSLRSYSVVRVLSGEGRGCSTVTATFDDGSTEEADILVGADGIWSEVRASMHSEPARRALYSGYVMFGGRCRVVGQSAADCDAGYEAFVGHKCYFVTSDSGGGFIQWYAFVAMPQELLSLSQPLGSAEAGRSILRYLADKPFHGWCGDVRSLLDATPPESVDQRAMYDRAPYVGEALGLGKGWNDSRGRVTLLGDAAHPMTPNLGQGGCMALEDAAELASELRSLLTRRSEAGLDVDMAHVLSRYAGMRQWRTAAVQGVSRAQSDLLRFWPTAEVGIGSFLNFVPKAMFVAVLRPFLALAFPKLFDALFALPSCLERPLASSDGGPQGTARGSVSTYQSDVITPW